jgi:hypothetical protein
MLRLNRIRLVPLTAITLLALVNGIPIRAQADISPAAHLHDPLNSAGDAKSGRINAIVVDPFNPNILYAASEWAGVWKSVDAANTWSQSSNGLRNGISQERGTSYGRPVLAIDSLNSKRILYATQLQDGRVPSGTFGGLWVTTDAAGTWSHVSLPGCPDSDIAGVGFSAGTAFAITLGGPSCQLFASSDPALLKWSLLPAPPFQPGDLAMATGFGSNAASGTSPQSSPTLFACQGTVAYRKLNATAALPAWNTAPLPGDCLAIAAAPNSPHSQNLAVVAVQQGSSPAVYNVYWVFFDQKTVLQIGPSFSKQTGSNKDGWGQPGSGIFGIWAPARITNKTGGLEGPTFTFDLYVADTNNFFQFTSTSTNQWVQLNGIHVDTWWMAFPPTYDPAHFTADSCIAYAASDGGISVGQNTLQSPALDCTRTHPLADWGAATTNLTVMFPIVITGISSEPNLLCLYGYPCGPRLYMATTDNDTWVTYYWASWSPYDWQDLGDGLGDSGWVLMDPAKPDYALAVRNNNYHMFVSTFPGVAPSAGNPWFDIIPTNGWLGLDPCCTGLSPVLTLSNESPPAGGDFMAIVSAYQSNANNCKATASCAKDIIARNTNATNPAIAQNSWTDISNGFFGPGVVGGIYASGGHANLTVYVMTDPDCATPGQIWKGSLQGNGNAITNWQQVGVGSVSLAYSLVVNPYNPDELYVTDLGDPMGASIKTSTDGGKNWTRLTLLDDIATNHGEFDFNCGKFTYSKSPYADKQIFGNQCSLQQVIFLRDDPKIRFAVLYPGGLAFSRDGAKTWIALDGFNNNHPSQQPIELPMSAFYSPLYDPDPYNNIFGLSCLYVGFQGAGIQRFCYRFATLEGGQFVVGCPACSADTTLKVSVPALDKVISLDRGRDGLFHGTVLFDSATVRTLSYQFLVDGRPGPLFTHTLTDEERQGGLAVLTADVRSTP